MKKTLIVFILVSINLFSAIFKLAVSEPIYNMPQFNILGDLITESFKKINYEVEFFPLPNLRALDLVEKGELDGTFPYFISTAKSYKNLYIVNQRIGGTNITAYTTFGNPEVKTWDDLKNKKVAYLLGSVYVEKRLKELLINEKNLTQTKDYASLLKLISSSRVDVALMDKSTFESVKTKKTQVIANLLETDEVFLFLNKKHLNIKNSLEKEIKTYKSKNPGVF